jgi:hypothetical protein
VLIEKSNAGFPAVNPAYGCGIYLGFAAKSFSVGVGGWGLGGGPGAGGMGFTDFQVVNYLIFREKVPEFYPRSLPGPALFEGKKV